MNDQKLKNRPPKDFYTTGSIIIDFFKSIIRNFLKIFNLDIYRTKYYERVERNFWLPFINKQANHLMKLYEEGLKRSEGEWSENFSRKLRYYSLFQMLEQTLKKNLKYDVAECFLGCGLGVEFFHLHHKCGSRWNYTHGCLKSHMPFTVRPLV